MLEYLWQKAYNPPVAKSAKLGQNFLRDEEFARRIVDLVEPSSGPLLEIGAGHGALSELLLERFPGRRVVLVEVEPLLVAELEQRLGGRAEILASDILKANLAAIFPREKVTVAGNLPYNISKPLVDWVIAQRRSIGEAVLMLQKDFIDKLLSPEGGKKYNAQSVMFQLLFHSRRCFDVPAGAFVPKPKVLSSVISAWPLEPPVPRVGEFYDFVKYCFAERRKTLWNNLAPYARREVLASVFNEFSLGQNIRAEQLPAPAFPEIFLAMFPGAGK
jgi:16S rRNA (adenine1518-N6/adenine1519-N6)-dimethyltransferase